MEPSKTPFVEEIDYSEIEMLEVVGKGSFGVVSKGKWRGTFVAVKKIEGESEKKAFIVERQQLSRVNHPNIVKLYGSCTKSPVCLVMEYADGGSLYNVLHVSPRANYTASHAMSWALQCAKGVSYLHDMKPKALVHRDLKPPNLLLIMGGTLLKICDFGTACNLQTHMTNNKGSAAWMAPEVFEGSSYSEKCDVFSWGIILWEVLTRQKPFGDLGAQTAFSIMWAVHSGHRPPLIRGCPLKIEKLMSQCWDKFPDKRPSMDYVVEIMTELFKYFKGADEPITFTASDDEVGTTSEQTDELCTVSEESLGVSLSNAEASSSPEHAAKRKDEDVQIQIDPPANRWPGRNISPSVMQPISVVVEEKTTPSPSDLVVAPRLVSQTSAPPSLASSQENLNLGSHLKDINQKRLSADLSPVGSLNLKMEQISAYKKAGSYGSLVGNVVEPKSLYVPTSPVIKRDPKPERPPPPQLFSPTKQPGFALSKYQPSNPPNGANEDYADECEFFQLMLEPDFQPIAPCTKSPESMKVFEEHIVMAREYIRVKAELKFLMERKQELMQQLSQETEVVGSGDYTEADKFVNETLELQSEKSSLRILHKELREELQKRKKPRERDRRVIDDWVMLP